MPVWERLVYHMQWFSQGSDDSEGLSSPQIGDLSS
jgi:hypothetical protein